jgi:hypothetical protein
MPSFDDCAVRKKAGPLSSGEGQSVAGGFHHAAIGFHSFSVFVAGRFVMRAMSAERHTTGLARDSRLLSMRAGTGDLDASSGAAIDAHLFVKEVTENHV